MAALATTPGEKQQQSAHLVHAPSQVNYDKQEEMKYAYFFQEDETSKSRLIQELEKEFKKVYTRCRESGWTDVSEELEEYSKTLETSEYENILNTRLLKIQNGIKKFKNCQTLKPPLELTEELKEEMSEVEESINVLKEEHWSCMIKIMREELFCLKEITAFETKFENWSLAVTPNPVALSAPKPEYVFHKNKVQERKLPAEVRALDTFLKKTGGLYGGWEEYEHEDFLKTWRKHGGKTSYREEATLYLPERKLVDILLHEDWYKELLCLQKKKREAIERWKAQKHQEHQTRIQMEKEEELQRRKEELKPHVTKKEREKVAKQLEDWRQQKEKNEEKEEKAREENEEQKREQEMEKRRLQLKVKGNIKEQLQLRKKVEEEEARIKKEAEEKEVAERRKQAAAAIKCSNEKDLQKLKEKLQEKQLREKAEEERRKKNAAKLKEKVDSHVTRDPSRLIRPTKGWQDRMKHNGLSAGARVQQMYRRLIPTWRQGQW